MMKHKYGSTVAAFTAAAMLCSMMPAITGLPFFGTAAAAAEAGKVELEGRGILSLDGALTREQILEYRENDAVVEIFVWPTAVLPEDCSELFSKNGPGWWKNVDYITMKDTDLSNVTNMSGMFRCDQADTDAAEYIGIHMNDTMSNVTDMSYMFAGFTNMGCPLNLREFDTSSVTDMSYMFKDWPTELLPPGFEDLDTSRVTNMRGMFSGCTELKYVYLNGEISHSAGFDTSNVTDMGGMFYNCKSLEALDLRSFDTSKVTAMSVQEQDGFAGMFEGCEALETIEVSDLWKTDAVKVSDEMFKDCKALVGGNGTLYDAKHTDKEYARYDSEVHGAGYLSITGGHAELKDGVLTLHGMVTRLSDDTDDLLEPFRENREIESIVAANDCVLPRDCTRLFQKGWDVFHNVLSVDLTQADGTYMTTMQEMFMNGTNNDNKYYRTIKLGNLYTSNVTDMRGLFDECNHLKTLDISGIDTSNVTDMSNMFNGCCSLEELDLSLLDTANVTDMSGMFDNCWNLKELDLSLLDTANVTNMSGMFCNCKKLTALDLRPLKTANVTNMATMFYGCENLTALDLSPLDTSGVTDMSNMFCECTSLTALDLSPLKTSNVTDMGSMFTNDRNLTALNLSGFDTSAVTNMTEMFNGCEKLETIYASQLWNTDALTTGGNMFKGCTALTGGSGTKFDENHVDPDYARVDGGKEAPGYLTYKEVRIWGDANCDGSVDVADCVLVCRFAVSDAEAEFTDSGKLNADVTHDGNVTADDAALILQYVAKKIPASQLVGK